MPFEWYAFTVSQAGLQMLDMFDKQLVTATILIS